jgi:hypothetical protein
MPSWDDVVRSAAALPEVQQSSMHGSACLRVHGKALAVNGSHVDGYVVIWCPPEEKAALLASGDPAFATAPHYDGHASILVDLEAVDAGQLAELVVDAWRLRAPARLRKAFDAG